MEHHRKLRTVFLDQGKEVLDSSGKSALLFNLRVLDDAKVQLNHPPAPNDDANSLFSTTVARLTKAAASHAFPETSHREYPNSDIFQDQILRLCVHEGLVPVSLSTTSSVLAGDSNNVVDHHISKQYEYYRRFPSVAQKRKRLGAGPFVTVAGQNNRLSRDEAAILENQQQHQKQQQSLPLQPLSHILNPNSRSRKTDGDATTTPTAPMTCMHCSLRSDVAPVTVVRPLDDSNCPRARYRVDLTALSEEEYDQRWWDVLGSLQFTNEIRQKGAAAAANNDSSDTSSTATKKDPQTVNLATAIAEHLEFRVGAPPWHELWTRLDRTAEELRERKLNNNEAAKIRLATLQHEFQVVTAQVKALSAGLLEVHPVDKARSLEAEEQRANYETHNYYEAVRVIEEQLKHLAELEARCLMHTGVAVEEARRAAAAINDFANFASASSLLSSHVDVPEVAQLLGDILATAPVAAKDSLHEAEILTNRKNPTNSTSQRFQCPDCLLLCQFSRYCPATGKLHPTMPVPGRDEEDEFFSSLAGAKASLILAQSGVHMDGGSTADHSSLAKLLMAAASLERQREREEKLEQTSRMEDGVESPPQQQQQQQQSPSPVRRGSKPATNAASASPTQQQSSPVAVGSAAAAASSPAAASPSPTKPTQGGNSNINSLRNRMASFRRRRAEEKQMLEQTEAEAQANGERLLQEREQEQQQQQEPQGLSGRKPSVRFGSVSLMNAGSVSPAGAAAPASAEASTSASSPFAWGSMASINSDNNNNFGGSFTQSLANTTRLLGGSVSARRSFHDVAVSITTDQEAEAFMKEHVHEMLQCAVRRDIEGMRWYHRRMQRILISADNKHIPKPWSDTLMELEKMFVEWFAAMVHRQREDAKLAAIGASRMSYERDTSGTSQSLRRGMLEDRIRKMRREVRELRYSIAKRPKRGVGLHGGGADVDDDQVFEALALRVRNLQRKKGALRSKIRTANDEHRAIDNRIHLLRGELFSPKSVPVGGGMIQHNTGAMFM